MGFAWRALGALNLPGGVECRLASARCALAAVYAHDSCWSAWPPRWPGVEDGPVHPTTGHVKLGLMPHQPPVMQRGPGFDPLPLAPSADKRLAGPALHGRHPDIRVQRLRCAHRRNITP